MRALAIIVVAACGSSMPSADGIAIDAPTSVSSRCSGTTTLSCESQQTTIGGRTVTFATPLEPGPWPVVVFFQGSFVPGERAFAATQGATFGQYQLTSTVKALLDRGYAVIAPNARADGSLYWQTNVPPFSTSWTGCEDDVFVKQLFAAMDAGAFGTLDAHRRYAMGISSGGYMTSRMAVSYSGTFRALAIASASYATCGVVCNVPALPADHPPTLFLHGAADDVVRIETMMPYRDALGAKADALVDPTAGHEWLPGAVIAVPKWFDEH